MNRLIQSHSASIYTTNNESTRRQDQLTLYRPNGAIYISTVANLLAQHSFYQKQISGFEMTDIESVDIDGRL